jgi:ATP-binding cassette, subfamily C (CFTR/MRP), member 4
MSPLIAAGYKNPLSEDAMHNMPERFNTEAMAQALQDKCGTIPLLYSLDDLPRVPSGNKSRSQLPATTGKRLGKAIASTFAPMFLLATVILLVEAAMELIEVYTMGEIISYLQQYESADSSDPSTTTTTTSSPESGSSNNYTLKEAYALAVGLGIATLIHGALHQHGFFWAHRLGFSMKAATSSLLYRKSVHLSKQSMATVTTGLITNLISTDVERLLFAGPFLPFAIVSPAHLICSTYFVWRLVGPFALCGMALIILTVPMHMLVSRTTAKLRTKSAEQTDKRVKLTSELLSGMRVIKMYAWEKAFAHVIQAIRKIEISYIQRSGYIKAANLSLYFCTSALVTLATFVPYHLSGHEVTATKVFTCYGYYNFVKLNMSLFMPNFIHSFSEMRVSLRRIEGFLMLPEHSVESIQSHSQPLPRNSDLSKGVSNTQQNDTLNSIHMQLKDPETNKPQSELALVAETEIDHTTPNVSPQSSICVNTMTCEWIKDTPVLREVTFEARAGDLICVVGPVGSGKSTLLMALLGELRPKSGSVQVFGSKSYSSQDAWILSSSIRDNICFGEPFQEDWYEQVVSACSLLDDFARFPYGDMTEVGERGVTLSGGQKARLSLARAVYANRDILLLDDPLSAVDTRVGRHIFQKCLVELVKSKLRILVTHQVQYLPFVDKVIVLDRNGQMTAAGTYQQLLQQNLLGASGLLDNDKSEIRDDIDQIPADVSDTDTKRKASLAMADSRQSVSAPSQQLVKAEDRKEGVVSFDAYKNYWLADRSCGTVSMVTLVFGLLILAQCSLVASDWFLSYWVQLDESDRTSNTQPLIYSMLVVALLIISFIRGFLFFRTSMHSSRYLHNVMFEAILRAPILFFDTNPVGRILNRFSKDLGMIDDYLVVTNFDAVQAAFAIVGAVFFVSIINPWIFLFSVPMLIIFVGYRQYYLPAGRDIRRIESLRRSPIFSHLSVTLTGIPILRCHNATQRFVKQMDEYIDKHSHSFYMFMAASRWLGFRLDMLSAMFVIVTVFTAIAVRSTLSAGLAALSLSYTLQLTGAFQW